MNPDCYHIPVMLEECIEGLNIKSNGIYLDLTYGGGGHSKEIIKHLAPEGHLYGFDQDLDAMNGAITDERFTFVRSNFRYIKNWMQYYGVEQVDGILADLGVSSHHLDDGGRGFSFRYDAPLDMRMNRAGKMSAKNILADYTEEQLADVFYYYGELKQSRRIASAIVKARATEGIETTGRLAEIASPLLGYDREKKDLARLFQALRIEVNGEMKALRQMLSNATDILAPGGRLVVMTYHSLEDRIVKNHIKGTDQKTKDQTDVQSLIFGQSKQTLKAINKNVITASQEELSRNPRSRSAKLRIAEKS
ncbi:MAG: 16S rRNA (cytosine(1402)-N(4))-methyltransferase RsmH [Bacteroidaceae bacterium]|nr:16S rRNA (cytosine(1402)-N(4))-methyltransferase RsmH [Bacteroidaceae bacterium]